MNHFGNAFVPCGVVYHIDTYNAQSTTINFAYDFKTGRTWNPNIQFTNQYGYNFHGGLQPHRKSAVRLGQPAFRHLSHHIRTNGRETLVSPVLNDAL